MGESHVNEFTGSSKEERGSSSSSFILESCSIDHQRDEPVHYQLRAPLCVSQTYERDFCHHFHVNYCGVLEREGLFLASIQSVPLGNDDKDNPPSLISLKIDDEDEECFVRAIIRTTNGNYAVADILTVSNEENMLQALFRGAQLSSIQQYDVIHHIHANEKLLEFDRFSDEQHSNKIAVLLQRFNQNDETEIFNNNDLSGEMEDFLNLISERVPLQNFSKYRGDLDIKSNEHGMDSYFTTFAQHQIMFNVAPLIPSDRNNQDFIQRKGLIGNALLCIVFQEPGSIFQPDFILGKVTQVYITVQPVESHSQMYYKIAIWRRDDVDPLIDPPGGLVKVDESFRDYFLTLLLNTISVILKKECFQLRIIDQRQRLKHQLMEKLSQTFSSYLKQNRRSVESNGDSIDSRKSDDENEINDNHRKESLSADRNRLSPAQHHRHGGLLPKIIEAFSSNHGKLNHSASSSDLPSKHSSLPSKSNSWIGHYGKIKRVLSATITPSTSDNESQGPLLNQDTPQRSSLEAETPSSSEITSALVINIANHIGPSSDKTSLSTGDLTTVSGVHTSLPLINKSEEDVMEI